MRVSAPLQLVNPWGVSRKTIYKWRTRFHQEGVEGLHDALRPGRPTVIDEETVQAVLKMTCEQVPREATHWIITLMSQYAQIST